MNEFELVPVRGRSAYPCRKCAFYTPKNRGRCPNDRDSDLPDCYRDSITGNYVNYVHYELRHAITSVAVVPEHLANQYGGKPNE